LVIDLSGTGCGRSPANSSVAQPQRGLVAECSLHTR